MTTMSPFEQHVSSASPTLVLPPPHQFSRHLNQSNFDHSIPFAQLPAPDAGVWSQLPTPTPSSVAGHKRSRDEAALTEEVEYFPTLPLPSANPEEDWEYGQGMTLIRPNGFVIDASSLTGTWADEKVEQAPSQPATPNELPKPILRSHKSQRLNVQETPSIREEFSLLSAASLASSSPPKSSTEPTIDDFTRHLGIGWSRISEEPDIQAAARGWARYIENHFSLSNAQIRLQSRGLASYLVEASEGYFLFGEDLREGRLVSTDLQRAVRNLAFNPPVFEGDTGMCGGGTPAAETAHEMGMEGVAGAAKHLGGFGSAAAGNPDLASEVQMDLS